MSKMLIDARHPEETRVSVVDGNRVEEFDYESTDKVQLKGNIYLAKVTRVEPSLQAAFVDYGGNRHGFLAFSEIHPDYYQIPVEDRDSLLAEEAEIYKNASAEQIEGKDGFDVAADSDVAPDEQDDEDIREAIRSRRLKLLKRRYKIQEVIKPKQILLIQIVKEERGRKGAAVTTYLSIAGRYTVLMPNTTHGGGISRKISLAKDRKRLRKILDGIELPDGMGCIIRTAGAARTKAEINRDIEYLLKLWDSIRARTLESKAPSLIYEEGNLIKRAIRDLYDREIEEILVEGDAGYQAAKDYMKLLMPSHAKKVQPYRDKIPLFHRHKIENQLDDMFQPGVTLKSGGYIVINPTEALIAVDVNSGRATKGHHIEETALKTNLEAANELARQLRLRDLSGLIVIDFIDMEDRGNVRKVEREMREALKRDRARSQIGRISSLGLMQLSRQRLRPNLVEASTQPCPHCQGTGYMRTTPSAAMQVIRAIEEEGIRGRSAALRVRTPSEVAFYILNRKRASLSEIDKTYDMRIEIAADPSLLAPAFEIDRFSAEEAGAVIAAPITPEHRSPDSEGAQPEARDSEGQDRRPRRRRGRRGGRRRGGRRDDSGAKEKAADGSGDTERKAPAGRKKTAPSKTQDKKGAKATGGSGKGKGPGKSEPRKSAKTAKPKKADSEKGTAKSGTRAAAKPGKAAAEEKKDAAAKKPAADKKAPKKSAKKPTAKSGAKRKGDEDSEVIKIDPGAKKSGPKRKGWWQRRLH